MFGVLLAGCATQREAAPVQTYQSPPPAPATQPAGNGTPAENYITTEAGQMMVEDQERAATHAPEKPEPTHRDSPMRATGRRW